MNEVSTTAEDARWVLLNNLGFYGKTILAEMVGLPGLFAAVTIIFLVIAFRKKTWRTLRLGLYLAWAVAMLPVLLLVGSYNERYLFFALPALLVIGYVAMFQGAAAIFGEQRAGLLPLAFTALWLIAGLFFHPQFLHGPGGRGRGHAETRTRRVLRGCRWKFRLCGTGAGSEPQNDRSFRRETAGFGIHG